MLRLKRYKQILIGNRRFKGVGQFRPHFHVEELKGTSPTNYFCTIDSERLQLCREQYLHKKTS